MTLNLADIVAIKHNGFFDSDLAKVLFYLKSEPRWVWNPQYEEWEFHNEPQTILQKIYWEDADSVIRDWEEALEKYHCNLEKEKNEQK